MSLVVYVGRVQQEQSEAIALPYSLLLEQSNNNGFTAFLDSFSTLLCLLNQGFPVYPQGKKQDVWDCNGLWEYLERLEKSCNPGNGKRKDISAHRRNGGAETYNIYR